MVLHDIWNSLYENLGKDFPVEILTSVCYIYEYLWAHFPTQYMEFSSKTFEYMDIHFPTLNIKLILQHIWKYYHGFCGHRFSNVEYRILYVSHVAISVQIFLNEIQNHILQMIIGTMTFLLYWHMILYISYMKILRFSNMSM